MRILSQESCFVRTKFLPCPMAICKAWRIPLADPTFYARSSWCPGPACRPDRGSEPLNWRALSSSGGPAAPCRLSFLLRAFLHTLLEFRSTTPLDPRANSWRRFIEQCEHRCARLLVQGKPELKWILGRPDLFLPTQLIHLRTGRILLPSSASQLP